MVVRTPPLGSLKSLFPQIHHPLPFSQRESRQLLDTITRSFRKNLDQEHPWETRDTSATDALTKRALAEQPRLKPHHPTDRHILSILSDPLFASYQHDGVNTSTHTATRHPCEVFDSAVSRGLMTPHLAAGFLATLQSQLAAKSPHNVRERMASSGAALRVLRWLRASGQENSLSFLKTLPLVKRLVPFLFAEGLQDIAWSWWARLAARLDELVLEAGPGTPDARALKILLFAIVEGYSRSDSQSPASLDGSFAALEKANYLVPSGSATTAKLAIRSSWKGLSYESTVNVLRRPKPSVTLFESFVDMGRPWDLHVDLAHLALHHPINPSHWAAVEYLLPRQRYIRETLPQMTPHSQQRVLSLVLDASERLVRTGQSAEMPWVERLARAIHERIDLGILKIHNAV
ncbi:hypothetical protein F4802DRAFT_559302 [Xylaria palmicola]|nr:hypothetical protein F4802DRAFT_559302 [Xylaria palmicola]